MITQLELFETLAYNTSGIRVTWRKDKNKWGAQISINDKIINLGSFDNIEDAATVYKNAAIKHFGEYLR